MPFQRKMKRAFCVTLAGNGLCKGGRKGKLAVQARFIHLLHLWVGLFSGVSFCSAKSMTENKKVRNVRWRFR
jgi:hypothetical protein